MPPVGRAVASFRLLLVALALFVGAGSARAELEVHASKRFEFQNMAVDGDFSQFLYENPAFLTGNQMKQNLRLEVTGDINERVSVDILLDDSIFQDEEKRLRVDVRGRVWQLSLGRFPVMLEGNRYLMAPRTGMGMMVTGKTGRENIEAFVQRPEGRTQRNFFQGQGALQEYVLTDASGLTNPLVVVGSERVSLDGRRLERGADYEMDYLEGAVLLARHLLPLDERNRLSVEFEEAGVSGSGLRSTLMGARYTRRFGPAKDAFFSVGFAGEQDQSSEDATLDTTGVTPGRLGVWEVAAKVPLAKGVLFEGRGGLSNRDEDTLSDEGSSGAIGAFDLKLTFQSRLHQLTVGRSLVDAGFRGVGLDRFQDTGERRFASRDGSANFFEGRYNPHKDLQVRAGYRDARSNLADDPDELRERVRTSSLEADVRGLAGGDFDFRFLGEASDGRAVGQEDSTAGTRDRFTAVHRRNLGRVGVSLKGEFEDATESGEPVDSYELTGAEITGPGNAPVRWSVGGNLRRIHQGEPEDPHRIQRDAHLGLSSDLGRNLSVALDARHRVERNRDPLDASRPPVAETNTGEARIRYTPGQKLEVELQGTGEVRSRILLDNSNQYQETLDSNTLQPPAQTAISNNPVVAQGQSGSVTYRPSEALELGLNYRLQRELDSVTDGLLSRDQSGDGRLTYVPNQHWRASFERGAGSSFNPASNVDRTNHNHRFEVARALSRGSSVNYQRSFEDTEDRQAENLSERRRQDRLGIERRLRTSLLAKGGLSVGTEIRQTRRRTQGFDVGVDWTPGSSGTTVGVGVEIQDVLAGDDEEALDSARKRWFLSAASKVGREGFVDLDVALTSAGPDIRGGEGYRALTSNVSVGVEF